MKKLDLAQRPQPESLYGLISFFVTLAVVEIVLGAAIPLGADVFLCGVFGSGAALFTTIMAFIFRTEMRDQRHLPEKTEAFLNQELSEKDYKAVYKTAAYPPPSAP